MFDKDLFFSLCEKYNIELSECMDKPMIKDADGVHTITSEDIKRIFSPSQVYFGYSMGTTKINAVSTAFYMHDDLAVAC